MIKLKIPTQKRFELVLGDNDFLRIATAEETPQAYIVFKQATTGEVEQRTGVLQNRKWKQEGAAITMYDEFNADYLARTEVRLTLVDTDISFVDGKALEFVDGTVNERQFNKWWNNLPWQWARLFHEFCLEVNPLWDASKRNQDTD